MIGDFGHSCWSKHYVDGKKGTPLRGTHLYAAPELDDTASDHTDKVLYLVFFFFCKYKNSLFTADI
jgi:hypothetical protein